MNAKITTALVAILCCAVNARAQEPSSFDEAAAGVQKKLQDSLEELSELREKIVEEKLPFSRQLRELEDELSAVRTEYQQKTRQVEARTLDLTNLKGDIKARRNEAVYLSNMLSEYARNFESRLQIAEDQLYEKILEDVKLAAENTSASEQEVFEVQAALITTALERLHEAVGGSLFDGVAVDDDGVVTEGTFAMIGPLVVFRSDDGLQTGTVEQRINSPAAAAFEFTDPEDTAAAAEVTKNGEGVFPVDPTLGNAHKVEATESETFFEHVQKGGAVMVPIFVMAALALLVALYKWLSFAFIRKPSKKKVDALLADLRERNVESAKLRAREMKGPVGEMLAVGVDHIEEPRELMEEVMYETVLTTRLKTERLLPFIAICAASAPLLGLLGTVTGIISTFKLITIFGAGDPKTLSGGISEALITTKFGLIVAIPSLLLHGYLSRKARGVVAQMEKAGVAFVNQVSKLPRSWFRDTAGITGVDASSMPDPELVRAQIKEILGELLSPLGGANSDDRLLQAGLQSALDHPNARSKSNQAKEVSA